MQNETIINKKYASFSKEWWDEFLIESKDFTSTKVFKDVIEKDDLDMLNREIMNILREIYALKTNNYGFRVYVDGKAQDSDKVLDLFQDPPRQDENISEYAKRKFSDMKFGMIINRTEKFSNGMAKKIVTLIQPLFEKVGIPLNGINAHILLGNYGWTPLGIHQDTRGDNVIHFHLGPAQKIMYNWEEKTYKELTDGKSNNDNIEPLIKYGEEYIFETGDIYYMPWNKWHVGFAEELSVGLTIWFNNPTRTKYSTKILDAIKLQYLKSEEVILTPDMNFMSDESFQYVSSSIMLDEKLKALPFNELLQFVHKEYATSIASNGGWENLPLTLKDTAGYDVDQGYEILNGKLVIAPYPFKMFYKMEGGELIIFARGYKVNIRYHVGLISILDRLNTNKACPVSSLLKEFKEDWPAEAGLYFLSLLYDKRAIEIAN
jgi:Cupin superfamily protein